MTSAIDTATSVPLDRVAYQVLADGFRGELIRPGDPTYEEHRRIWNGSIDRRPALIARCAGVADVIAGVRSSRASGLPLALRGGGHSFPGFSTCDGGIVLDLGPMKGIRVDPAARRVRVQAGARLGDLDHETQAFGMVVPAGIVTHTGVAGLTLGGGIGWTMRKYGLTIDQLLAVDLVTAGGELVHASEHENAELFWGLRGGGGNFGVVTEFEFRLNPLGPMVMAGPIFWRMEDSREVLRRYREWIAEAPDELTTIVFHRRAPAADWVPADLRGRQVVIIGSCYAGPVEEAEKVVEPLRRLGRPVLDLLRARPFTEFQGMFDAGFPSGWWYYFRSCDVAELSDGVIDTVVEHSLRMPSPINSFPIFQLGGALARVDDDATAFHGRHAGHTININGETMGPEGFDEIRAWSRGLWEALRPYHRSVYVNFLMDEGEERIRQAYGPKKYDRLKALKRHWDPENLFRLNQNIPPD